MASNFAKSAIFIAADHGGFELKNHLVKHLEATSRHVIDLGTHSTASVDYPDYASLVAEKVLLPTTPPNVGILVCGSGIGISIAANKIKGIRCGLCHDHYTAVMTRRHNNANVLALGGRVVGVEVAKEIVDAFLETAFDGGHHQARIDKIHALESE